MAKRKTGTLEWAEINKNIFHGCQHCCTYCYAKAMAKRFNRIKDDAGWEDMHLNEKALNEKPRLLKGRILFPSTHDIIPEHIDIIINYLRGWLEVGNEILIVSKPHQECIQRIVDELDKYKNQITFRFTIGSVNDDVLKFWEPNAPSFEERLGCLQVAYTAGFNTSVSCEPYLDEDINLLVQRVLPYVTDTVWLGLMNKIKQRVNMVGWTKKDKRFLDRVVSAQTNDFVEALYNHWKDDKQIRWKDSIKTIMDLPEEEIG